MRLEKQLNLTSDEIAQSATEFLGNPVADEVLNQMERQANDMAIYGPDDDDAARFRSILRVRLVREFRSKLVSLIKKGNQQTTQIV